MSFIYILEICYWWTRLLLQQFRQLATTTDRRGRLLRQIAKSIRDSFMMLRASCLWGRFLLNLKRSFTEIKARRLSVPAMLDSSRNQMNVLGRRNITSTTCTRSPKIKRSNRCLRMDLVGLPQRWNAKSSRTSTSIPVQDLAFIRKLVCKKIKNFKGKFL
jgi:hypothetical protein